LSTDRRSETLEILKFLNCFSKEMPRVAEGDKGITADGKGEVNGKKVGPQNWRVKNKNTEQQKS